MVGFKTQRQARGWPRWSQIGCMVSMLSVSTLLGCVVPTESDATSPEHPAPAPAMPPEMVPEQVSDRVLAQAAQDLQLPISELSILRVNQETWTDGCLGLGRPDEGCLQALVPGWQVEVVHHDTSDFYRTDADGTAIRRSPLDNNLPPSISTKVLDLAATETGLPAPQLQVTAAEPQVWDGCLGIAKPDTVCTEIAIFGWRAVVAGNGAELIYHTDMAGDDIRLNDLE